VFGFLTLLELLLTLLETLVVGLQQLQLGLEERLLLGELMVFSLLVLEVDHAEGQPDAVEFLFLDA
jgi:hypothetical protein